LILFVVVYSKLVAVAFFGDLGEVMSAKNKESSSRPKMIAKITIVSR